MNGWSDDVFLGGRLTLRQPKTGLRAGSDSIFLAAAVAAKDGDKVLDVGAGCGVVALSVAQRVTGAMVDALEIQPSLADLTRDNARRNGLEGRIMVIEGDLATPPQDMARNAYDWVATNPPYHDPASTFAPPDAGKAQAHVESALTTAAWVAQCLKFVRPKGYIAVIQRADRLKDVLDGLNAKAGDVEIIPLWPKAGTAAVRVIVRARKSGKGPTVLTPGLVLHHDDGAYTEAAEDILRHGAAFPTR